MPDQHAWPEIRVKRFEDETLEDYAARRNELVFIIDGFRHGKFAGELADQMDLRLEELQTPPRRMRRPNIIGNRNTLPRALLSGA